MRREILINAAEEVRVAILEDGSLVEFYVEKPFCQRIVGNIYKGKVENVLPGMEAAFINIGLDKNAFLYVDDALSAIDEDEDLKDVKVKKNIRDILHPGQEITVQVVKDSFGTKGARVTTNLTFPGRFLVLMPTVDYIGVSRRIADEKERDRLRAIADKIKPKNIGLIVRTAAEGKSEKELRQDLKFLMRLWGRLRAKGKKQRAPALLHKDLGLISRIIRDEFGSDVDRVYVDAAREHDRIMELLGSMSPALKERVQLFDNRDRTIFEVYGLEAEIEKALKRKVWLKSGSYLIFDQVEALTVIDVNTGMYVGSTNLSDTVFKTNLEAAEEIARQLRLRDIGGIIVIDFIDMESEDQRQRVLQALEKELAKDRTKTHILGFTHLGLLEMTRKKVRHGLKETFLRECPYCEGSGSVTAEDIIAGRVKRELKRILKNTAAEALLVEVHPNVASMLIGPGGSNLKRLEEETGRCIYIKGASNGHIEDMDIKALGSREEVEAKALPVRKGEILEVRVEEPHASNGGDGISRIDGYIIDIHGAGKMVGEKVKVEITKAYRTYAKAKIV